MRDGAGHTRHEPRISWPPDLGHTVVVHWIRAQTVVEVSRVCEHLIRIDEDKIISCIIANRTCLLRYECLKTAVKGHHLRLSAYNPRYYHCYGLHAEAHLPPFNLVQKLQHAGEP